MKRYSTGYHLPAYVTSYLSSTYDKMSICSKYVPRNAMMEGHVPLGYGVGRAPVPALELRRHDGLDGKRHRVHEVGPLPVHRDLGQGQVESTEEERDGNRPGSTRLGGLNRLAQARDGLAEGQKA